MHFETWPNLIDAAKQLNTSVRTIQRHIAAGKIEASKRQVPGRSPETVVNPADIDRMRPTAFLMPVQPSRKPTQQMELTKAQPQQAEPLAGQLTQALATLATIATAGPPRQNPPIERAWLTLAEAADCSGLSRRLIRALINEEQLTAIRDGRQWKVSREALAAWRPRPSQKDKHKSASSR